jgi:hypothetical protein
MGMYVYEVSAWCRRGVGVVSASWSVNQLFVAKVHGCRRGVGVVVGESIVRREGSRKLRRSPAA